MPRLLIISELFYPNESATAYILTEMAKKMATEFDVKVICANTNYEGDSARISNNTSQQNISGISTVRVSVPELDKNNIAKRLVRFLSVSRKLYKAAMKEIKPSDVVFAVTNPAFLLPYMRKLKRKKHFEYVLLVHDVFPENALATGVMKNKPIFNILKKFFDKAYATADKLIVLGEDMKEVITSKTGRTNNIFVCENWGQSSVIPSNRKEDGKIVFQYAGNIGRVQGLEEVLEIINSLNNVILQFDFWGSGALVPFLNTYIAEHGLINSCVRGSYNRSTQNDVLNDCDMAIVSLARGMKGLGVPSKTYNIMAAGKPILYIGDQGSEIYNLVKEHDIGVVFDWNQKRELLEWLNNLSPNNLVELKEKGERARVFYESNYTKDIILNKILTILK